MTDEIVESVCIRLAAGEPLAQICRDEQMPALRTVYNWVAGDGGVSARIARAREAGEDMLAAECLRIADTPIEGVVEKLGIDPESGQLVVLECRKGDMLGHRKLQIETRLKLLAKWNPKKWGDRQTVEHDMSDDLAAQIRTARMRSGLR